MTYLEDPKSQELFCCKVCDYSTSRLQHFNRHNSTRKHQILTDTYQGLTDEPKKSPIAKYVCNCGKKYQHKQSLYNHRKKCNYKEEMTNVITTLDHNQEIDYKEMFFKMVEENKEVRTLLITQQQQMESQQKMMGELIPKIGNTTNNNTINNNQRFNINVFLNDKCKDAINMSEFIDSIKVSVEQLDLTKNKGLEQGLSNIIIENMNKLSLYERPLHCTDTKRETLYIKNDNTWEKDKDKSKIKKAIKKASGQNYQAIHNWVKDNPDYMQNDDKKDFFVHVLSSIGKPIENIDDKVIKKICTNTYVKGEQEIN